jgi:hypothetical protein
MNSRTGETRCARASRRRTSSARSRTDRKRVRSATVDTLNRFLAHEHEAQGNEAAAAALRAKDPYREISDWYMECRRTNPGASTIPVLEERLRHETHPSKVSMLRLDLGWEYAINGDYASATAIRLDAFKNADIGVERISSTACRPAASIPPWRGNTTSIVGRGEKRGERTVRTSRPSGQTTRSPDDHPTMAEVAARAKPAYPNNGSDHLYPCPALKRHSCAAWS